MTNFQETLRRDISGLFAQRGVQASWTEEGLSERYYHCRVDEYQMEIWIYTDEACCQIGTERRLYEKPASPSLEHMKMEVLQFVKQGLSRRRYPQGD